MQTMHKIALLKLQTFLWFLLVCGVVGLTIPPQFASNAVSAYDLPHDEKEKKESNGKRSAALDMSASDMASHRAILDALIASCAAMDAAYGLTWHRHRWPTLYERWYKGASRGERIAA